MLEWIDIRNFVIAKHVELDLHPGLSVITGETGAGKSIIMDALALVLGERAGGNVVRHGENRAEIQAGFDLSSHPETVKWLQSQELDDENQCIVRRVIPKQRSSKAFVNGRSVPASLLRELGENLVDIHSQHEHQSLLRADTQRQILDRYARVEKEVLQLSQQYDEIQNLRNQLNELQNSAQESQDRLELIQFQLQEFDAFSPSSEEWPALEIAHQKINHAADLSASLNSALNQLVENESNTATQLLHQAGLELTKVLNYDTRLQAPLDLIEETQVLLDEASQRIRQLLEDSDLDESELLRIEQRFSGFHELARKHRVGPEALYEVQQSLIAEQTQLASPEEEQIRLRSIIDEKQISYISQAKRVSLARDKASQKLAKLITSSMQTLAMEGGFFNIRLSPIDTEMCGETSDETNHSQTIGSRYGLETIHFEVSTNKGMPAQALGRVASGGELSRISLAIQVIIADIATVATLVFDEVDVGVGGKTASTVGNLLRQLAEKRQIICITHLPQVAARGEHHYNVNKSDNAPVLDGLSSESQGANAGVSSVSAEIIPLSDTQRVEEIARMVGGETITQESLAHARSLINAT